MTARPPHVRLARGDDADALFALVEISDGEWALGLRDDAKVREVIALATAPGDPPRPSFGMIEGPAGVEGAVGLYPTELWNCRAMYLRGFYHFVHPQFRRGDHAKSLMAFAEWFADTSDMPLVWELLHPLRTAAKAELYGRRAQPFGGLWLYHGAGEAA